MNIYSVRQKQKSKKNESPKMNANKTPRNRTSNDPLTSEEANLQADIEKTQVRLDGLPPSALTEAKKLIGMYQDVLKRLEGF